MFRKLVIFIIAVGFTGSALAAVIGNPTSSNSYDTTIYITATASSNEPGADAFEMVNGSGMDASTGLLAGTKWTHMWFDNTNSFDANAAKYQANVNAQGPAWVAFEFDKVYKLKEMRVWNYNEYSGVPYYSNANKSIKNCTVEYSSDGTSWTVQGSLEGTTLTQAPGKGWDGWDANSIDATQNTLDSTVTFGTGVQAKYVVITVGKGVNANYVGSTSDPNEGDYGLSEVRFVVDMNEALFPNPTNGQGNRPTNAILTFVPGEGSDITYHKCYISTNQAAVVGRTAPNSVLSYSDTTFEPSLLPDTTYYWAVDELNSSYSVVTGGSGDTWVFSTYDIVLIDTFDDYDTSSNFIYNTWVDDYGVYNSGSESSLVQYGDTTEPNLASNPGDKILSLGFDNDGAYTWDGSGASCPYYSEVRAEIDDLPVSRYGSDWTVEGMEAIWAYVAGRECTSCGGFDYTVDPCSWEKLYVKLEDGDGNVSDAVEYTGPSSDFSDGDWHIWMIDLDDLTDNGVDLDDVNAIIFGFGDRTDTNPGTVGGILFDDVRLHPARCADFSVAGTGNTVGDYKGTTKPTQADGDLNLDCKIDLLDIEILVTNWLAAGTPAP